MLIVRAAPCTLDHDDTLARRATDDYSNSRVHAKVHPLAVQGLRVTDDSNFGYLQTQTPAASDNYLVLQTDSTNALRFIAVRDPGGSNVYQLQVSDGTGRVIIADYNGDRTGVFAPGKSSYTDLLIDLPTECGAAGSGPVPAAGTTAFCETFVFGAQADARSYTTTGATLNLTSQWVNPGQTTPQQYFWDAFGNNPPTGVHFISGNADPVAAQTRYNDNEEVVQLRFPVILS